MEDRDVEDFELRVRFRRDKGAYEVLGFSLEHEGHIPYGALAMFKALFRKITEYVLPGVKLIEKMTFGLGAAPIIGHRGSEWLYCYLDRPPVKGQPSEWRVRKSGPPRPYYRDPSDLRFHAHQMLVLADRWEEQQVRDKLFAMGEIHEDPEQMQVLLGRLLASTNPNPTSREAAERQRED